MRVAPWLTLLAFVAWTARPSLAWIAPVPVLLLLVALSPYRASLARRAAFGVMIATLLVEVSAHFELHRIAGWPEYWAAREAQVFEQLERRLDELLADGERTVDELADLARRAEDTLAFSDVRALVEDAGLAAAALFDGEGRPIVWAGEHRGRLPEAVRLGLDRYAFAELPLFSYLYFTAPVGLDGTTVVAALLRSDLPPDIRVSSDDFAARFRRATGESIRISSAERAGARSVYDVGWEDRVLFSVAVAQPGEEERRSRDEAFWVRWVTVLAGLAWLLLLVQPEDRTWRRAALVTLGGFAVVVPWGAVFGEPQLFAAAHALFPTSALLTLGRLLAIAFALGVAGAVLRVPWWKTSRPWMVALVALGLPALLTAVEGAATPGLLAGPDSNWVAFELALTAPFGLLIVLALTTGPSDDGPPRWWGLLGALLVAAALSAAAAAATSMDPDLPTWAVAVWALPVLLAARSLRAWSGWRRRVLSWSIAIVLASTAALPYAWTLRTEARIAVAERQLGRLGTQVDPYLRFLLERVAAAADSLDARGAGPVELLYRSWVDSGLAAEAYPVWLTLFSEGNMPREELEVGVGNLPRPPLASDPLDSVRAGDSVVVRRPESATVRYAMHAPLSGGDVLSVIVPPQRGFARSSPLVPLFGGLVEAVREPVTLVPLLEGDVLRAVDATRWERTPEGWRGERGLRFPDAPYHAQYLVELPSWPILIARATLLVALNLALMLALWASGAVLLGGARPAARLSLGPFASFRARVTFALFSFFLLSIALFGTLAYRNISDASSRAARVLAERVAKDAAEFYLAEGGGRMDLLASRVGGELLEYRDGLLREGAVEVLVELGTYEGWLPYDAYRSLSSGQVILESRVGRLGTWEYVTAYRRLPDGDIVGVPVPMEAGALAIRRREVAHLLASAIVVGAALSFVLALLVGRTLTRPMNILQLASERVGAGNFDVRLPSDRSDEFGSVFAAFNRMVRRLRRTRRALVRTTRRTKAIVEDAATGVVALDDRGAVSLANPRAEALMGRAISVGEPLATDDEAVAELADWVRLFVRDGLLEGGAEFQFGDRRIRVRARRIARGEGPLGGTVLSLEDVTDELRTERILAWGEMARQVAHEVKNPLTPIKLSVQHVQRAWADRRSDFEQILTKNVEAMLLEIDRLAAISSSFSRLGAPLEARAAPLEPVDLGGVTEEVLALYASGSAIRFTSSIPEDVPPVSARADEVKEVLINLLENARSAIADHGTVEVGARVDEGGVVLRVEDSGAGIAPELLPRIFEPHFSTRSGGTGLGLAIVGRLVDSWGGAVSARSELGSGTTIAIRLRAWMDDADQGGSEPPDS